MSNSGAKRLIQLWCRDSSVDRGTRLRDGLFGFWLAAGRGDLLLFRNVQSGSVAHLDAYGKGTKASFTERKAVDVWRLTPCLHLDSSLRAALTLLPFFYFMFECPRILDKQIKVRPNRCNQWWFIGNQLFLNMFRASLRPSSGEQTASHSLLKQHPFHSAHIPLPNSPEPQQRQPRQNTTGSDLQSAHLMRGVKAPQTWRGTVDCQ
jgi:hypothetical protein